MRLAHARARACVPARRQASELGRRGFFDMMKVTTKLDEQRSERVIGWFLTHDTGEPCSIAGPFYQNFPDLAGRHNATPRRQDELPISKRMLKRGWGRSG